MESHDDGCIFWLRIPCDGIPLPSRFFDMSTSILGICNYIIYPICMTLCLYVNYIWDDSATTCDLTFHDIMSFKWAF